MEMTDRELLELIAAKVGGLETKVGGLETRFDGLETKFGGLETKFGELEMKFGGIETRIDNLDVEIKEIKKTVINIENDHGNHLKALHDGYVQNSAKLERIEKEVSRQEEVILRKIK